ncbi:MAG TPA: DUF1592 domain-containing protein [Polyangia bacterium]|nr:DUF1592 domain-containing protein [Polyangia bacterium]
MGVLGAGLVACTGKIGETSGTGGSGSGTGGNSSGSGKGGSTSGTGGSGSGSGTGGSGNGSGTGSGGSSDVDGGTVSVGQSNVITCAPGIAATSQIPRMLDAQYDNVISDLLGVTGLTSMSNAKPSSLLSPDSTGSLDSIAWNGYQTAASTIAAQVFASSTLTANFMSCSVTGTASATATCLQNTVQTFGRKIFRRPLTTTEVSNFMALNSLTPAGTGTQVAQAILTAFLESPSFIMLPELTQTQTNGNYQLNSYEVAARLSFLFLNSVPDATLSTAADNNQLTTKAQILAQAKRLLMSAKASQMANAFAQFYLAIENGSHWMNNTTHDTTKYPAWDSNSYAPAMAEINSFFQNLTLNGGKFSDLFLSTIGYVTKDTAPLYGLSGSTYTSTPTQVTLDSTQRPGFLTRVGFLSTFAHFDVTSPIFRGAFISGRVLGINPGVPNAAFLNQTPPAGNYTTERQAIEALVMNQPCQTCHGTYINPTGFVLEHYNSVGSWQDTDPLGGTIDGTADVYFNSSDTETISSPLQLMTKLSTLSNAQYTYAQNWVSYATGRVANANDACTVNTLTTNLAGSSYTIANMMADYTQADSFSQRTMGN